MIRASPVTPIFCLGACEPVWRSGSPRHSGVCCEHACQTRLYSRPLGDGRCGCCEWKGAKGGYRDVGARGRLAYLVLEHLPPTAERRAEQVQVDLDVAVVDERAVDASLDVCDAAAGPRAGVR